VKKRNLLTALLLVPACLILIFTISFASFCFAPISSKPVHIILKTGSYGGNLIQQISSKATQSPLRKFYFKGLIRLTGQGNQLRAGEYYFKTGSSPYSIIKQVAAGNVVQHPFTLVNGWNIYQVLAALRKDPYLQHTLRGKSLKTIAHLLNIKHSTPEGELLPNTYYFVLGASDLSILQRAHQAMRSYLKTVWPGRKKGLRYRTPYQALIVASLIEKETGEVKEMPIIADVILKRLKKWMHLQIDSTVIYGLEPNFNGRLTISDLRKKTPYNTYTKYGLPPTPIAMPSKEAIHAALHPATTPYWYFVATGKGGHVFSRTLAEQNKAVEKYQLGQN
jgi:UPF0755 protein